MADLKFEVCIDGVCNAEALARQERLVSVTQAFAIDLAGQACAEALEGTILLWENAPMLHVLERAAATVTVSRGHGSAEVVQLFE